MRKLFTVLHHWYFTGVQTGWKGNKHTTNYCPAGLLVTIGFAISHSVVQVADTDWVEPVLLWIAICMQTGSGKSGLCKFLKSLVSRARSECKLGPAWCLDDQSFGAIMSENHGKLLGLYDELPMFLSQINVFSSRGVTNSHEVATFLQLYGASEWVCRTGK